MPLQGYLCLVPRHLRPRLTGGFQKTRGTCELRCNSNKDDELVFSIILSGCVKLLLYLCRYLPLRKSAESACSYVTEDNLGTRISKCVYMKL